MDVVDELVDRGVNGIDSISELSRRMSIIAPQQQAESWRKALRRSRKGSYKEELVALVARAFNISRDDLPAARTPATVAELDRRLAALEAAVGLVEEGETVGNLLEELATKLGDVTERVRALEAERGLGGAAPTVTR